MPRVLFLSDNRADLPVLAHMVSPLPFAFDHADSLRQAETKLRNNDYNLILTEITFRGGNWVDALELARNRPDIQVIVTGAHADARLWAEALNLGAYDVLAQPFYEPEVRRILSNACSRFAAV